MSSNQRVCTTSTLSQGIQAEITALVGVPPALRPECKLSLLRNMYSAAARQQKYLSLARDNTETLAPGGSVKGSVGVIAIGYLIVALREPPRFARLINNENLEAAGLTLLRRFRR